MLAAALMAEERAAAGGQGRHRRISTQPLSINRPSPSSSCLTPSLDEQDSSRTWLGEAEEAVLGRQWPRDSLVADDTSSDSDVAGPALGGGRMTNPRRGSGGGPWALAGGPPAVPQPLQMPCSLQEGFVAPHRLMDRGRGELESGNGSLFRVGSVLEGRGAKLTGRRSIQFRAAVMRQTGFLEASGTSPSSQLTASPQGG